MRTIIFGILFVLVLMACSPRKTIPETQQISQSSAETVSSTGQVSIDLTNKGYHNGQLHMDISMNTHSVDMSSLNLKELVTLDINGKSYKPIEVPTLAGHHNSGTLVFEVSEEPKSFTVTIKDVPDVPKRTFKFGGE